MRKYIPFIFMLSYWSLYSQNNGIIEAKFTDEKISLDGVLDEKIWSRSDIATEFWQYLPKDSVQAMHQTEVRVVFDDKHLYFAVIAKAPHNDYVVSTLRRDFVGTSNDNISLLFDTFKDGTNGYVLGVTPYGVQRDVWVSLGGASADAFNGTWDIKWKAESKRYDQYYIIEVEIPFTSLKFKEGSTSWNFRPYRWNLQTNEQSTWIRVPQTQTLANLAYMGELRFEKPLGKSRTPFAIIPYVNGLVQNDNKKVSEDITVGADAKISIGDGMNLDLTANPDFSNVEVDDIFTNLSRFEFFLPEKRQFFIDNSDLFGSFGNTFNEARPFFSRRIGLARNKEGQLIQNRILGGARLSGKLNKDWRLGILNIQTANDPDNNIFSQNNTMLAIQRKIFSRSNIGVFFINREAFGITDLNAQANKFNRVFGIDYNLSSKTNDWLGKFYVHKSLQPDDTRGNLSAQATITYNKNNWVIINDLVFVDKEFRSDLGFVPRTDIFKMGNGITKFFIPKDNGLVNRISLQGTIINYWKPKADYKWTDQFLVANVNIEFKNQSRFIIGGKRDYIFLTAPFDPARKKNGIPLPGNTGYAFNQFTSTFQSTKTGLFTIDVNSSIGQFFNGASYTLGTDIGYRVQPWVQLTSSLRYDGIRLPEPYSNADLWLLTQRFDITFSKKLFWSTTFQYSNQRQNIGINTRLQWRYAQLSDLFLVYNDNYESVYWMPTFRSVNLKVSYWLNM
ncbi:MAG: hypothetical protein RIR48_750 [Bacteroidota bacterium]